MKRLRESVIPIVIQNPDPVLRFRHFNLEFLLLRKLRRECRYFYQHYYHRNNEYLFHQHTPRFVSKFLPDKEQFICVSLCRRSLNIQHPFSHMFTCHSNMYLY